MAVTKGTQTYLARAFSSASVEVPYERGVAGTGQPTVRYAKLNFEPANMFAVGSPIGLFVTVRGVTSFGLNFKLPTCGSFYNIFHPVSIIIIIMHAHLPIIVIMLIYVEIFCRFTSFSTECLFNEFIPECALLPR